MRERKYGIGMGGIGEDVDRIGFLTVVDCAPIESIGTTGSAMLFDSKFPVMILFVSYVNQIK